MINGLEAGLFKRVDQLLDGAIVSVSNNVNVLRGDGKLAVIDEGTSLVIRDSYYQQRCIADTRFLLSGEFTTQPVVALAVDGEGIIPLPYAEDVLGLPRFLAESVIGHLETLSTRNRIAVTQ